MSLTDHLATTLRLDLSRSRWFALASVEQVAIKPTPEMEKLLKASPGVVAARRRLEELKERLGM